MFNPTLGRWISEDPIDFAGGDENLYRFVGNNPTAFSDPTGLQKGKEVDLPPKDKWKMPKDDTLGGDTIRKAAEKEREEILREIQKRGATKIQCPTDICGFRFTISNFTITSIEITKIEIGTAPWVQRNIIRNLSVKDIKDYIESELKGKKTYTYNNCKPGCTPDYTQTKHYSDRLQFEMDKVPIYPTDDDWYVIVSGTITLTADASLTPCKKK